MKKHRLTALLFSVLLICSAGAFVYLNSMDISPEGVQVEQSLRPQHVEEVEQPVLPDILFIQKAVKTLQRFVPAF